MKRHGRPRRHAEHARSRRSDTLAVLARLLNTSEVNLDKGQVRGYLTNANSLAALAEVLDTTEVQLCEHQELAGEFLNRAYSILENAREPARAPSRRRSRRSRR